MDAIKRCIQIAEESEPITATQAEMELRELHAEVSEWREYQENFARIMADEFHVNDEQHCTCVPMLRDRLVKLEAVAEGVVVSKNTVALAEAIKQLAAALRDA